MGKVTKVDIIIELARKFREADPNTVVDAVVIRKVIEEMIEYMQANILDGNSIYLQPFGVFKVKEVKGKSFVSQLPSVKDKNIELPPRRKLVFHSNLLNAYFKEESKVGLEDTDEEEVKSPEEQ